VSHPVSMPTDLMALSKSAPVHFMGIGGAGMQALAELVLREGGRVSGCDVKSSAGGERLARLGVRVGEGHEAQHVEDASALVITSAVPKDHPEVRRARERGIPVLKRAEALGAVVNRGRVVAVAGTHGKTTTTAMATKIIEAAGMDPTGLVGGTVRGWESNLRHGKSDLFVVEADEYDRSFLTLDPDVAVVTNVEADHLDIYGDLEGVREGFRSFVSRIRPGGRLVACADDVGAAALLNESGLGYTYGLSAGSQLRAVDVTSEPEGVRFRVEEEGKDRGSFALRVPGRHNLLNALGASAAARAVGASWDAVRAGLGDYRGVERRLQLLGEVRGVTVLDDYAHHPTEIEATVRAVRESYPSRRIVALFQPHLYSRTRDFAPAFGRALALADAVWVTDVFPARERAIDGVNGRLVSDAARTAGGRDVHDHASIDDVHAPLSTSLRAGDVLLTLGAGSIERVGARVLEALRGGRDA
jgi:UDP-N-acetylmuramate--alanine ligase